MSNTPITDNWESYYKRYHKGWVEKELSEAWGCCRNLELRLKKAKEELRVLQADINTPNE